MTDFQRTALALILVAFIGAHAIVCGQTPSLNRDESQDEASKKQFRLREGAKLVEQVGEFREAGGRIAFYPEGASSSLQLLENLALERVARDLDQRKRKWSVTGIVTEFRGGNYLLLHRAVQKARSVQSDGVPRS